MSPERHLALAERATAAFADEIDRHEPAAPVAWPWWPDVRTLIGHLGGIHAWVAAVVRTGEAVPDPEDVPAPVDARRWYLDRRAELLDALRSMPPERPCWVIAGADRTTAFWRRRMVFETTKHLTDLRASGGGAWAAAAELAPDEYADGVDELFAVFLHRSRATLPPLPGAVVLEAMDGPARWSIRTDWSVSAVDLPGASCVRARTCDLALFVWDRADPLAQPGRFTITGDPAPVVVLRDAPIHS